MNSISQIFFAIAITSFTGALALRLWRLLIRFIPGWKTELAYMALRCVCLLYVLPVGYLVVRLTMKKGCFRPESILFVRYIMKGNMRWLFTVMVMLWLALSFHYLLIYFKRNREWYQKCRFNVPEEDPEIVAEFCRIKKKLGIHRRVRLCRNPKVRGPVTIGLFRCTIILPTWEMSEEERKVTFYHELCHVKGHDALFRFCGIWVGAMQHSDTKMGLLSELIKEWSECDCDVKAVTAMEDEMSAARYFEVILDMMEHVPVNCEGDSAFSMLYEDRIQLEKRIDYMKQYASSKRWTRAFVRMLTLTFALLSITVAYGTETGLAEVHNGLCQETNFISEPEGISYGKICLTDTKAEKVRLVQNENEMVGFHCAVGVNACHVSKVYDLKKGQRVSISCTAVPASSNYWIGIMDDTGNVWYVDGTSSVGHDFAVPANGKYRVLVQNRSETEIEIMGDYCYYTL